MNCYDCKKPVAKGVFRCDSCYKKTVKAEKKKRLRPMSDYEKLKLGWYRSDKAWEDNIRSREITKDKFGKTIVTYSTKSGSRGIMPEPPREIWAKPKHLRR